MININNLIDRVLKDGYDEIMSESKVSQDIILKLMSSSRLNNNVTIKGGVLMHNISKNIRRATLDIDFDLIRFPIDEAGIKMLIRNLNNNDEGVKLSISGKIEKLKHQDYQGSRVVVRIQDAFDNEIKTKMDIGVHKYMSLEQVEYCFDISSDKTGVVLLVNTKEQMFTEKLNSLLRFGYFCKRFKDIYDMYYLIPYLNKNNLSLCFNVLIYSKNKRIKNSEDVYKYIKSVFYNKTFLQGLNSSNRNWLDVDNATVLKKILQYLNALKI